MQSRLRAHYNITKSEAIVDLKKVKNHAPVVFLEEQIDRLTKFLNYRNSNLLYRQASQIDEYTSPLSGDVRVHWCVFVHPYLLLQMLKRPTLPNEYDDAVRAATLLLARLIPTRNNVSGKVELKPIERTKCALDGAVREQGLFYFLPVQFGSRYSNMKFRTVPAHFAPHEYGLTLLQCITIALTHRIELTYNEMWDDTQGFAMAALGETCLVPENKRVIDTGSQIPLVHSYRGSCIVTSVSEENGDKHTNVPTFFWKARRV